MQSSAPRPSRLGLALFGLYLALYAGFVLLNSFQPALMEWRPFGHVNLALLYGLGLIAVAFVLAVLYDWLRRAAGDDDDVERGEPPA
jgi:uncharacterized membrane protein (DUF485 family)